MRANKTRLGGGLAVFFQQIGQQLCHGLECLITSTGTEGVIDTAEVV